MLSYVGESWKLRDVAHAPLEKGLCAEYFTGTVRIDPLFDAANPPGVSGGSVTFEPGAGTACIPNPLGQTLVITSGVGRCSAGRVRSKRSGPVMSFGSLRERSTGMAQARRVAITHIAI